MIQTILFAADMGVHTPYLLHHVDSLALRFQASVIVLHVIEPAGYMGEALAGAYISHAEREELQREGVDRIMSSVKMRIIDAIEDEFIDGQSGLGRVKEVKVAYGKPADEIIAQAVANAADLVILGSHSADSTADNMLGSVTSKVLQLSRVPVYMVPVMRKLADSYPRAVVG
jgi:nucleotide-binding universal stress UspA family protein